MKNIPDQYTGAAKDVDEKIHIADQNEAKEQFLSGRNRLMNVNDWEKIAKGVSATFHLTDQEGVNVQRTPRIGDHLKIDVPVSGAESRYDWVKIEDMQETQSLDGTSESALMRVRPSADPQDKEHNDVKHFFTDAATSTFMISRVGGTISAGVYSRNEEPNVSETESVGEKLRNTVVAIGAMAGLSNIQWKSLVKGILNNH